MAQMPIVQEGCLQKNYTNPVEKQPFNSAKPENYGEMVAH
jgi:hypothetical protein